MSNRNSIIGVVVATSFALMLLLSNYTGSDLDKVPQVEPTATVIVVEPTLTLTAEEYCESLGGYVPIDTGDGIGDGEDDYPPIPPDSCVIEASE